MKIKYPDTYKIATNAAYVESMFTPQNTLFSRLYVFIWAGYAYRKTINLHRFTDWKYGQGQYKICWVEFSRNWQIFLTKIITSSSSLSIWFKSLGICRLSFYMNFGSLPCCRLSLRIYFSFPYIICPSTIFTYILNISFVLLYSMCETLQYT
jgi:hypothetical protein